MEKESEGYSSFTVALRFNLLLDIKRLAWPFHGHEAQLHISLLVWFMEYRLSTMLHYIFSNFDVLRMYRWESIPFLLQETFLLQFSSAKKNQIQRNQIKLSSGVVTYIFE